MHRILPFILILALFSFAATGTAPSLFAQTVGELRTEIDKKNAELAQIEKEIAQFQAEILKAGNQATSLKKALAELELAKKKLLAEIRATEKKISIATTNIKKLDTEITDKEKRLNLSLQALSKSMRNINDMESQSAVEMLLSNASFSGVWEDIDTISVVLGTLRTHVTKIREIKGELESDKTAEEREKKKLLALKNGLSSQQKVVLTTTQEKNRLLAETRNKETEYQQLLIERQQKKLELEREILEFEGKLKVDVDVGKLPPVGSGVLAWPLDKINVTQYFGMTPFATKNPQVYNGKGHTGVDFRATVGTPVKSAATGRVVDIGNTDTACYGVSYGKWVLIRHDNGLTTLYSHLSVISVGPGEAVETGEVIGYSGNTGYTTGPHLHFAVFASDAVRIPPLTGKDAYVSRTCGTSLKLPVSPWNGYLNPLSYL